MLTLKILEKMREVINNDRLTYTQGKHPNTRTCKRISETDQLYIRKFSIDQTPQQISDAIGHTPNSIRAYARRHGINIKKARHYE